MEERRKYFSGSICLSPHSLRGYPFICWTPRTHANKKPCHALLLLHFGSLAHNSTYWHLHFYLFIFIYFDLFYVNRHTCTKVEGTYFVHQLCIAMHCRMHCGMYNTLCIGCVLQYTVYNTVYYTVCNAHCALAAKQIRCQSLMLSFTSNHHLRNTDEKDDWKDLRNALLEFEKYNFRNQTNIVYRTREIDSHNQLSQIIISKFQFEYYLQVVYVYWNFTFYCAGNDLEDQILILWSN